MAPPQYKLTYFDFSGLGEPIRLLFYYGGIDFIDNRITKKDWPALKSSTPFGQMPFLEVNGRVLHQSLAVARYVAKQVRLVGNDDLENCEIDSAVDTVNDLRLSVGKFRAEKDPQRQKELKEWLDKDRLIFLLSRLDAQVKQNNGYLANGKLSWADMYFVAVTGFLQYFMGRDFLEGYPNLIKLREAILSIPNIKAWIDKRPPDNFE